MKLILYWRLVKVWHMVLQRLHEDKHWSTSGFTDCGRRNVNTWIHVDSDTPDPTECSDSAPDSAQANRTSPGYTERQTDRQTAGDVSGCLGNIKQEEGICLMKRSCVTSSAGQVYQYGDSASLQASTESRKSTERHLVPVRTDGVWAHWRFNLTNTDVDRFMIWWRLKTFHGIIWMCL